MARINLLPWREQLREERKQRFLVTLAGVLVVAGGAVFLGDQYLNGAIEQSQKDAHHISKTYRRNCNGLRIRRFCLFFENV